jgi:hypothetical protein
MYPETTLSTPSKDKKMASVHQKQPPAKVATSNCGFEELLFEFVVIRLVLI